MDLGVGCEACFFLRLVLCVVIRQMSIYLCALFCSKSLYEPYIVTELQTLSFV